MEDESKSWGGWQIKSVSLEELKKMYPVAESSNPFAWHINIWIGDRFFGIGWSKESIGRWRRLFWRFQISTIDPWL